MANVTQKPNGTYLVRISCGRDIMTGKQILRGRTFKPSKPNLSQKRFEMELNAFIEEFTEEVQFERNRKKPENKIISDFSKEYLAIKRLRFLPPPIFCTKGLLNNIFFQCSGECVCAISKHIMCKILL